MNVVKRIIRAKQKNQALVYRKAYGQENPIHVWDAKKYVKKIRIWDRIKKKTKNRKRWW